MSGGTMPETSQRAQYVESGDRRGRRRWPIVAVALVLIAAGAVVVVRAVFDHGGGRNAAGEDGSATSVATVERRSLSTRTQFSGTLGYAGDYTVFAQSPGTVTWLPKVGRVIRDGQVLYRVDGAPVVLFYGSTPAYRPVPEGLTAADLTGRDVAQLNHDLAALGYVDRADVDWAWDEFTWATRLGVEKLQAHLGVDQTGRLDLGDMVFLPKAARVTALQARLGGPATGPVLSASSTTPTVTVALEPDLSSHVKAGDRVTITLPDGSTTPGRVTSVGRVATISTSNSGGADTGPTLRVRIRPTHPRGTGNLDQALVEVSITDRTMSNVLAVPVAALLARSGDRYAVEVVSGDGTHRLIPVRPGLFDDAAGLVQVSGSRLAAGQRVVVPGNE
jgi:hypothetical protein